MSDEGFHVHGPHDHALEHAAEHGGTDGFASHVAVLTAILATVGALLSYESGSTQAAAGRLKNDAGITRTDASDQWNFYQAKSAKQNLAELGARLSTDEDAQAHFRADAARYEQEKGAIRTEAQKLEAKSKAFDEQSEHELHLHHRWAQSMTAVQISIALAAIALLTRRRWLLWAVYAIAAGGAALAAMAAAAI
jgi:hypothetical protein